MMYKGVNAKQTNQSHKNITKIYCFCTLYIVLHSSVCKFMFYLLSFLNIDYLDQLIISSI